MTSFDIASPFRRTLTRPSRLPSGRRQAHSPVRQLYVLLAGKAARGDGKEAGRMALRAILAPRLTSRWLAYVHDLCERSGAATIPFDLVRKPTQPFLASSLQPAQRASLLATHYERLSAILGVRGVRLLLSGAPLAALALRGRSGAAYRLQIGRSLQNRREGELNLQFIRVEDNLCLASLGVVVGAAESSDMADLWIGGLQGCKSERSKSHIVEATRDLWGLRPKDLLIHAAYLLAELLGARRIKAVSNAAHVHSAGGGRRGWSADYDAFWRELGGERLRDGFFLLPNTRLRRAEGQVPSAKRKAWRARYALIDDMRQSVLSLAAKP